MKRVLSIILVLCLCAALCGCGDKLPNNGTTQPSDTPEVSTTPNSPEHSIAQETPSPESLNTPLAPPDLTGEWKQVNSNADDSWQSATITDNAIEIYWVSDNGDTYSLYWSGTFVPPESYDESYSWESENDHEKTDNAMLASMDDTKIFTYENSQLSYSVSLLGTTTIVRLEKTA